MNIPRTTLCLLMLAPFAPAIAQDTPAAPQICLAPASVESNVGNAADAMTAVRESFTSFLAGPTLVTKPLNSRLESQVREEAKTASCPYLLLSTVKHERKTSGGGLLHRMIGSAAQQGAWSAAGAASGSIPGRIAATAAAEAASAAAAAYANSVRVEDEITLRYRLEASDGRVLVNASDKRKAKSNGEDMLTPLVQHAAEAVAAAVAKSSGTP